jgi:nucleoside-diphosphate-sugar epimerase
MTTVAITGSSGFIGQNLCERLRDTCRITTMDKQGPALHVQDLTKGVWPRGSADVLVHLASISNVYVPPGQEDALIQHNLELVKRALFWCEEKGVPFMIHASSSSVYGDRNSPPQQETDQLYPMGAYGESKKRSEEWLTENACKRGIKVLSFRFFNAIGKYQKKSMLPWILLEAARTGRTLPLHGECWRSWTAVGDICAVIHEAIMHPTSFPEGHTIVNLGLDNPLSQLELLDTFRHLSGDGSLDIRAENTGRRPFEMRVTKPDNRLFNQLFAYRPSFENLEQAVLDVLEYHRAETAVCDTVS